MAKMPGYENFLHDIAMKALEYEFEGKTIREWIDILKTINLPSGSALRKGCRKAMGRIVKM